MKRPRLKTLSPRLAGVPERLKGPVTKTQRSRGLHTGSAEWRRLREEVLVRDGYRCADCKRLVAGKDAHVDHIDGDSNNQLLSNLACRCVECHGVKTRNEQMADRAGRPRH